MSHRSRPLEENGPARLPVPVPAPNAESGFRRGSCPLLRRLSRRFGAEASDLGCRRPGSLVFIVLIGGLLVACSGRHARLGAAPVVAGWTTARWAADPQRLEADLRRCVGGLHWAVLGVQRRPAALELEEGENPVSANLVWKLQALVPDGREAQLLAWTPDGRLVEARARVGRFGDPSDQHRLLEALKMVMEGPALRRRHDKFELP